MPLPNVYSEQIRAWDTDVPTTRRLPSGEVLVGNKSYESLMRFFTTFNITPTVLKKKAWERLYDLHNQVWLKFVSFKFVAVHWFREGFCWNCTLSLELSVYVVFISLAQNPGYLNGKGISKINICQMSVNSNFRGFWLAHVTRNILGNSLFCDRSQDGVSFPDISGRLNLSDKGSGRTNKYELWLVPGGGGYFLGGDVPLGPWNP